jgi:hypothetical protein
MACAGAEAPQHTGRETGEGRRQWLKVPPHLGCHVRWPPQPLAHSTLPSAQAIPLLQPIMCEPRQGKANQLLLIARNVPLIHHSSPSTQDHVGKPQAATCPAPRKELARLPPAPGRTPSTHGCSSSTLSPLAACRYSPYSNARSSGLRLPATAMSRTRSTAPCISKSTLTDEKTNYSDCLLEDVDPCRARRLRRPCSRPALHVCSAHRGCLGR